MKHVSILIPEGNVSLANIDGTHQLFSEVNNLLVSQGKEKMFDIHLVGVSESSPQRNGLIRIHPNVTARNVRKTDLIVIPAFFDDLKNNFEENKSFLPWIVSQYEGGAEIASFCIGSFFLARTGLLDNKKCSTHWNYAADFRRMFPAALLQDDRILTEDQRIYTSGGAYSYLNLLIYLVEKYTGRQTAILMAKMFMIDIDKSVQSPFIIFQGQKTHEDAAVRKAQEYIESNFEEKLTVEQLAAVSSLGRRSFERRFKKATSNTVAEYIQRVKMEAAKKRFETSTENVNEVMYGVGYSDSKTFRTTFRKITGLSPNEYRNKYNLLATA
jgi:transcriptional regulator GlxA family with amidase domain